MWPFLNEWLPASVFIGGAHLFGFGLFLRWTRSLP